MPETLQSYDIQTRPVPAAELFATKEQIAGQVATMLDNGGIKAELHNPVGLGERADVAVNILVDPSELAKKPSDQTYDLTFDQLAFKDPDTAATKEAQALKEEIVTRLTEKYGRLWGNSGMHELMRNGTVQEAFVVSNGKVEVPILNFTNAAISDEKITEVQLGLSALLDKVGDDALGELNGIFIEPAESFEPGIVGGMHGGAAVMRLHEGLITGEFDKLPGDKYKSAGVRKLTGIVTHEFAHLVESLARWQDLTLNYGKDVGWKENPHSYVTDDYGNVVFTQAYNLRTPDRVTKTDEGAQSVYKTYGADEVGRAKPTTSYGYTDKREDFAEASVHYAHGALDEVDAIRADSLSDYYKTLRGEKVGTSELHINRIDPGSLHFGTVPEQTLTATARYMLDLRTPEDKLPQPGMTAQEKLHDAWDRAPIHVTDDYGNEVTADRRAVQSY